MNRTKIAQLYADADAFAGKTVTVAGWVKSVRDMKNFGFVSAWMIFSSSWQAWPETWSMSARS